MVLKESYEWAVIPTNLPKENLVLVTAKTPKTTIHPEDSEYPVRIFKKEELHEAARSLAQRPVGINHSKEPIPNAFTVDAQWNEKEEAIEALLFLPDFYIDRIRRRDITKVSVEYTWRNEKRTEAGVEFSGFVFNRVDLLEGKIAGDSNTQIKLVEGVERKGFMEGEVLVESEENPLTEEEVKNKIKELENEATSIRRKLYPEYEGKDKEELFGKLSSIENEVKGWTLKLGQLIMDKELRPKEAKESGETDIKQDMIDASLPKELQEAVDNAMKTLGEPFAGFKDWSACIAYAKKKGASNPEAYCGYIKARAEPKKKEEASEETFEPPEAGTLPTHGKKILANAYNSCRTNYPKYSKERCSKIAWGAVKNAGYTKEDDKWVKKEGTKCEKCEACEEANCTPEKIFSLVETTNKQVPEETNPLDTPPQAIQAVHQTPAPVDKPVVNVGSVGFTADSKGPLAVIPEEGNPKKNLDSPPAPEDVGEHFSKGKPDTDSKPIGGTQITIVQPDKSKQAVESTTSETNVKEEKKEVKQEEKKEIISEEKKEVPPPVPSTPTPTIDPKDVRIKELEETVVKLQDNAKVADNEKAKAVKEAVKEIKVQFINDLEEVLPAPMITDQSKGARILANDIRKKVHWLKESLKE